MTGVVVDASAALAWILRSQSTPASAAFVAGRGERRFVAPYIFHWEVGNVLTGLRRRGVLSDGAHEQAMLDLDALRFEFEEPLTPDHIRLLGPLALAWRLTLFDTAYVALALEREFPLASRDDRLLAAGASAGIRCIDLRGDRLN
ncbi:type II toxin-antitoxin system VapC family toxin [Phenylobacterium sp.]|uniref:type II toxin-antitoxin system VapC family toxin n=1 Tax=Phenylobacterium sp. TaxID=1871053 RepID=UPI0025E2009C|nr:type II toxin-antitoxin system VapC family toxin [Phenylobacterium sp.]MBX3483447.1 type II toxin-antitoxin system VapC family toxin [Phenylobacterium sp.]MCW5758462.1 type II toxin-antitoxin system VapC family toxin [Phenylobacterium sp.]